MTFDSEVKRVCFSCGKDFGSPATGCPHCRESAFYEKTLRLIIRR